MVICRRYERKVWSKHMGSESRYSWVTHIQCQAVSRGPGWTARQSHPPQFVDRCLQITQCASPSQRKVGVTVILLLSIYIYMCYTGQTSFFTQRAAVRGKQKLRASPVHYVNVCMYAYGMCHVECQPPRCDVHSTAKSDLLSRKKLMTP